jgi:predicted lipid-binding transport protein (Tim44 family)
MTLFTRARMLLALVVVALSMTVVAVDYADARRGGSFGSRGIRTYQAPRVTPTAPNQTAPVERSMTPRTNETSSVRNPGVSGVNRPGFFSNGLGGSLMRGLLIGGLFGMLLGYGFGGAAGLLGFIVQLGLLALAAMFLMRMFRGRPAERPAYAGAAPRDTFTVPDLKPASAGGGLGGLGSLGGLGTAKTIDAAEPDEVGITQADLDNFERLLVAVQDAYAREDFAGLRALATPEVAAFFSEELGRNAAEGLKNEVRAVKLLQGDLSEAWREGSTDYATVAMRYESIDATRERATGRVVEGDPDRPTEATEIWTFLRRPGEGWILSAIQT